MPRSQPLNSDKFGISEDDKEMSDAYKKARSDEERDLRRLGEIIEKNMLDWWD